MYICYQSESADWVVDDEVGHVAYDIGNKTDIEEHVNYVE